MKYCIVAAPGGSGLNDAVIRLTSAIALLQGPKSVSTCDVEEEMCRLAVKRDLVSAPNISTLEVTYHLPPTQVIELWSEALEIALRKLARSRARHKLLSCHFTLYNGRRRQFYSPVSIEKLVSAGRRPTHLLLLIDDAFDMFARLAGPEQVFDFGKSDYIDEVASRERVDVSQLDSVRRQLELKWKLATLASLLSWRHADMLMAESAGRQVGAHYLAFGVKQPTAVAARWLTANKPETTYISHPITRPRSERRWPRVKLVSEFNQVQTQLLAKGSLAIMPTAIDEYRFKRFKSKDQVLSHLQRQLSSRWPIQAIGAAQSARSPYQRTLYKPSPNGPELTYLFGRGPIPGFDVDGWLQSFEGLVGAEIAFRDHHLVACCSHILVFRPLYREGTFTRGVAAEIAHWGQLANLPEGRSRRAVVIHFEEDLRAYLRNQTSYLQKTIESRCQSWLVNMDVSEGASRQLAVKRDLGRSGRSLLDAGEISPRQRRAIDSSWRRHRDELIHEVIWNSLTSIGGPVDNRVGLWIVPNMANLTQNASHVSAFLQRVGSAPNSWRAFADRIAKWVPNTWFTTQ